MDITLQQRVALRKFVEMLLFVAMGIAFWRFGPTWRLPRSVHYFLVVVTPIAGFVLYRALVLMVTRQLATPSSSSTAPAAAPFSQSKQYQFPKRFGLTTLAMAMTGIALLAGVLLALELHRGLIFAILAFVSFVTIVQSVMDRVPRSASIIAGAIYAPTVAYGYPPLRFQAYEHLRVFVPNANSDALTLIILATIAGALCGYLTGTVVAGLFLAIDVVTAWWNESTSEPSPANQTGPWD